MDADFCLDLSIYLKKLDTIKFIYTLTSLHLICNYIFDISKLNIYVTTKPVLRVNFSKLRFIHHLKAE